LVGAQGEYAYAFYLNDLVAGIESILAGRLIGKKKKQRGPRFGGHCLHCDFGSCGIVYRPDRL